MAISNTIAYIHDIDKYIADAREVLDELILCITYLNKNASHLIRGETGNLKFLRIKNKTTKIIITIKAII